MSEIISKKYNVSEESFRAMVKDGVISTSWPFYEEVIIFYRRNGSNPEAVKMAADKFRIHETTVYKIIKKL